MSMHRVSGRRVGAAAAIGFVAWSTALAAPPRASAAGLYFSDRGVRPIGRGGAFVAGADDLGALWYNPAGLAFAGNAVLADAGWLRYSTTFQRRTFVKDPTTGDETIQGANYYPEVKGNTPVLPIPTLAIANNLGVDKANFALGVMAPYAALTSYPEGLVDFNGRKVAAPQRYSLYTLDGSALVVLGAWASYQPIKEFAIGVGLQMLTGTFASRLAFSACPPENLICAGEDPSYDAVAQLNVGPIVAPSGNIGATAIVSDDATSEVRLGFSAQLPFWISARAKSQIRLPAAEMFRVAFVEGDEAEVRFRLPAIVRGGIETRLGQGKKTRLELSVFYEGWSIHDQISIAPIGSGIRLRNVAGLADPYQVGTLAQARGFRDTFSIHAGFERAFEAGGYPMQLRGGASFERSAVPAEYLSVLTVDVDKLQAGFGGSIFVGDKRNLRLDAVLAWTFGFAVDVDPRAAAITKVKAIRANDPPDDRQIKINGGRYTVSAQVVGVGLSWAY